MINRLRWSAFFAWHLRGQARFPFQPPEVIQKEQSRRLRRMVTYAYRAVPYYRETFDRLGLRPSDFRTADDLAALPLVERDDIHRNPDDFRSTTRSPDDLLRLESSGSTGAKRPVMHDARGVFQNAAHGERERSIWTEMIGRTVGYREMVIGPPENATHIVQTFCRQRAWYPPRVAIEREYVSMLDHPSAVVGRLNAFKPDIVYSYGSYLSILFGHLASTGEPFHRPTVLTYTSDGLSDAARRLIEQRFGLRAFATYQSIEAFKIGFECEQHLGLHVNADLYPVRIVDASGRTLPPGESGEVIVSNLVNGGTVLLNYRLGDIATQLPNPCPCGRSLPLLSFPQGRSDDLIELPSGRIVHPQVIRGLFDHEHQVWEYQVVHQSETRFRVSLLVAPDCDRDATRQRLARKFADLLGQGTVTEVVFVDAIDRTSGGKFRPVISLRPRSRLAALRQAPRQCA